jgi:hypothetical protein
MAKNQNQRMAHQLTMALWRLLRDRTEVDRRFVYNALVAAEVPTAGDTRVALAVHALETCSGELGRAPSRRAYDTWRATTPQPDDYLSSSGIRNVFGGSWPKALEAVGFGPAPDVLARRLLYLQRGFAAEECVAAIQDCVAELNAERAADGEEPLRHLTFNEYKAWARGRVARWREEHPEIVGDADDTDDEGAERARDDQAREEQTSDGDVEVGSADEGDGDSASRSGSGRGRAPHGSIRTPRIPINIKSFHRHFAAWPAALAAAGFAQLAVSTPSRRFPGPRGPHQAYSREHLIFWLKEAAADLAAGAADAGATTGAPAEERGPGTPNTAGAAEPKLTQHRYRGWRLGRLEAEAARGRVEFIPGLRVIQDVLGPWSEALAAAGLITPEQQAFWRKQPLQEFTPQEMTRAVAEAIKSHGRQVRAGEAGRAELEKLAREFAELGAHAGKPNPVLSRAAYKRWRKQMLREDPQRRVPSDAVIHDRMGGWDEAVLLAVQLRGDYPRRDDRRKGQAG